MSNPVVELEQGKLKGKVASGVYNRKFYCFKGIPYARPPFGELRFSVPQPPEPWDGVRDATIECNICAQFDRLTETVIGDEDCLYLNVYTPKLPSSDSTPLPVMVYFHGGGFVYGNGTDDSRHGPQFLIEKDVVLVSLNYRLGILGFLSLDRKEAPGNMGLMDQVQALKWVQNNIARFSGDPGNVTIFGVSAGGASVEYLMLSPMAKGLFHKAIAQSGSSLLHWAHNKDIKKLASQIPTLQGKVVSNEDDLLKYLMEMSTVDLISAAMQALRNDDFKGGINFGFVPTIERPGDWEPFLNKPTYEILAKGQFNKVPFMTGFCTREGLLMMSHGKHILDKLVNEEVFLDHFPFDIAPTEKTQMESQLKAIYKAGVNEYKEEDSFAIDFFTDVDFLGGCYVAASLIAKHNSPVYFYQFAYDGNLNYLKKYYNIEREGACHGDDTGYILRNSFLRASLTEDDVFVRDAINEMWSNFAKCGNPTPTTNLLTPVNWQPVTNGKMSCFVIDKTPKMTSAIYPERMQLYIDLYKKKCGA